MSFGFSSITNFVSAVTTDLTIRGLSYTGKILDKMGPSVERLLGQNQESHDPSLAHLKGKVEELVARSQAEPSSCQEEQIIQAVDELIESYTGSGSVLPRDEFFAEALENLVETSEEIKRRQTEEIIKFLEVLRTYPSTKDAAKVQKAIEKLAGHGGINQNLTALRYILLDIKQLIVTAPDTLHSPLQEELMTEALIALTNYLNDGVGKGLDPQSTDEVLKSIMEIYEELAKRSIHLEKGIEGEELQIEEVTEFFKALCSYSTKKDSIEVHQMIEKLLGRMVYREFSSLNQLIEKIKIWVEKHHIEFPEVLLAGTVSGLSNYLNNEGLKEEKEQSLKLYQKIIANAQEIYAESTRIERLPEEIKERRRQEIGILKNTVAVFKKEVAQPGAIEESKVTIRDLATDEKVLGITRPLALPNGTVIEVPAQFLLDAIRLNSISVNGKILFELGEKGEDEAAQEIQRGHIVQGILDALQLNSDAFPEEIQVCFKRLAMITNQSFVADICRQLTLKVNSSDILETLPQAAFFAVHEEKGYRGGEIKFDMKIDPQNMSSTLSLTFLFQDSLLSEYEEGGLRMGYTAIKRTATCSRNEWSQKPDVLTKEEAFPHLDVQDELSDFCATPQAALKNLETQYKKASVSPGWWSWLGYKSS